MAVIGGLPTLYEYYTSGGITEGLSASNSYFTLNGRNVTLYSGAMHYFRTPKQLWRDRLRKIRAAGLNTVESYVPWNLHEPQPGFYDFGNGGSDMQEFLDISEFLQTAKEEDLFAIIRPGPYICAEWEFGGFPSWLLREKNIKFRTSDEKYMKHVKRFFNALLPILALFQFTRGGPIISFQVENEYGSTTSPTFTPDKTYLEELRQLYIQNNITELLFTSDGVTKFGDSGTLPQHFLITANFEGSPNASFKKLEQLQPHRPKMVMEYYPGWFDHWGEEHHTRNATVFIKNIENVLKYPGSFNLYMMHGGTSFGFMNGANVLSGTNNSGYQPDTTSYDYDALLTESGDYTEKYELLKMLLDKYADPKLNQPAMPPLLPRKSFPTLSITKHMSLNQLIANQEIRILNDKMLPMELLPINNNTGQSYGYIVYKRTNLNLEANSMLKIIGHLRDTVLVFLNGKLISPMLNTVSDLNNFGFWRKNNATLRLNREKIENATLELVVENWGRVNYGKLDQFYQFKGILCGVTINDVFLTDWIHIPLEFKRSWNQNLKGWSTSLGSLGPGLYAGTFSVEDNPVDTYIDMRGWKKGIVIVNGFVLGRYCRIGPQQCLYLPSPFIKKGENEVIILEHYRASDKIDFSENQIYQTESSILNWFRLK